MTTIKLLDGVMSFRCKKTAEMIICVCGFRFNKDYYSPDGINFVEWKYRKIINPMIQNFHGNFELISRKGNPALLWNRKLFEKIDNPEEINLVTPPAKRKPWYLFKKNRDYIYISYDETEGTWNSVRIFFGSPYELRRLNTDSIKINPNGSFVITTPRGKLVKPSRVTKKHRAKWVDIDGTAINLAMLDVNGHIIEEDENIANIKIK